MAEHTLDIDKFRKRFPSPFSDEQVYTNELIEAQWEMATVAILPYDNWLVKGNRLQLALELMTAHLLYQEVPPPEGYDDSGNGALISSATEGSVSISTPTPDVNDFFEYDLSTTRWGRRLLALLESLVTGGFVIGGSPETAAIRDVGGLFSWQRGLRRG